MDASGNAVAIWVQGSSTASTIESANLPSSGAWTTPVALSAAGASGTNPTLAVNASGDAIAGWQTSSSNPQIVVAERRSGIWQAPVIIAPAAFRQNSPHVALNDNGDAAIAWTGRGTALVATRPAGGAWSAPATISTSSLGGSARVALDDSGNAIMIFQLVKYTGSGYTYPVEAVARSAGGSWGVPVTVSGANDYGSSPNVVATPLGTFVVGWADNNTLTARAAIRPSGQTGFGPPSVLSSGNSVFLAAAAGHTAAIWIGSAVQVSDAITP